MKKKILFIINPISGKGKNESLKALIPEIFPDNDFTCEIAVTTRKGQITEFSFDAAKRGMDAVIVAGGDGSVHEAGIALVNSGIPLGIIPCGSGNGFARHFGIPTSIRKSLETIREMKTTRTDSFTANGEPGLATCGMGFDALISKAFLHRKKRGLIAYIFLTLKYLPGYNCIRYHYFADGKESSEIAFAFTIANTSQYGNNAYIAPQAVANDRKLDIAIIRKIGFLHFPFIGIRLFTKSLHSSSKYRSGIAKKITLLPPMAVPFHIDGEPREETKLLEINIVPDSLVLIVPSKFL